MKVPHLRCNSHTSVKRSKVRVTDGRGHTVSAEPGGHTACYYWTLQKEDNRRRDAFEIWIWRRLMKVPWTEHKTNEEILQMVESAREIMDTVKSLDIRDG